QEVMAPAEGRLERLLSCRRLAGSRPQEPEAVVEPGGDRRRRERTDTTRRELERKREPVEPEADPRDVVRVLVGHLEAVRDSCRPLDEQAHGLEALEIGGARMLLGVGYRERGDTEDDLARDAERFAAGREQRQPRRRAEELGCKRSARREHVLAVVEDEQQLAGGEKADDRVLERLPGERLHVESGRDGRGDGGRAGGRRPEEDRPVGKGLLDGAGELERKPGLPGAAGAGQRQHATTTEEGLQLAELVTAPDEGARVGGEPEAAVRDVELLERRRQSAGELLELVAAGGGEVVVAVLRQELAAVERERSAQGT